MDMPAAKEYHQVPSDSALEYGLLAPEAKCHIILHYSGGVTTSVR